MANDLLAGKKIQWTYDDGPVKGMKFEHAFTTDGKVTYREVDGTPEASTPSQPVAYQVAPIDDRVYAVSYLANSGWTLTTVVDERRRKIVSFASNEKSLVIQHGRLL